MSHFFVPDIHLSRPCNGHPSNVHCRFDCGPYFTFSWDISPRLP